MSSISIRGRHLCSNGNNEIMGILNTTPDSFFSGSRFDSCDKISKRAEEMIKEGASIIDIGGCSTKPGAKPVDEKEEIRRVSLAVKSVRKISSEILISVDTFRSEVAKIAVNEGADIINDISAGLSDKEMFPTIADLRVPYIMMHGFDCIENAHNDENDYDISITEKVILFLSERIQLARQNGISDIIIDPGFGFNKSMKENYKLMSDISQFDIFSVPILVGVSRKRMAWQFVNTTIEESLNATTILNTAVLLSNRQTILRVHDVKEVVQVLKITNELKNISICH